MVTLHTNLIEIAMNRDRRRRFKGIQGGRIKGEGTQTLFTPKLQYYVRSQAEKTPKTSPDIKINLFFSPNLTPRPLRFRFQDGKSGNSVGWPSN